MPIINGKMMVIGGIIKYTNLVMSAQMIELLLVEVTVRYGGQNGDAVR
jgi:hypothetical protein